MKYRHLSKNSTKIENGISMSALKKAEIALYFCHLLESHRPTHANGKNNISERKLKKPSLSFSMVSSCALFFTAIPAKRIKAINMKFKIIDEMGNLKK